MISIRVEPAAANSSVVAPGESWVLVAGHTYLAIALPVLAGLLAAAVVSFAKV